jgi:hypothetical protein
MMDQGGSYTILRRALERGSLVGLRSAVPNLPAAPPLEDALVICRLLLEQEPDRYERAAVRWLGRLLLEQEGVSLQRGAGGRLPGRLGRCGPPRRGHGSPRRARPGGRAAAPGHPRRPLTATFDLGGLRLASVVR